MKPYKTSKKRKHPRKGEKRNKGQGPKSRQADGSKEVCHM
jgi:hypothetical protein